MANVDITEITASSFYKSEAFGPANLIDGDKNFGGWITDVAAWQNAWIEFQFSVPTPLTNVEICNGFIEAKVAKTRDDYYFHKRAMDITISFADGGPEPIHFTLNDVKEPQILALDIDQPVETARITVTSVYDGSPDNTITPYDVLGLRHVKWHTM